MSDKNVTLSTKIGDLPGNNDWLRNFADQKMQMEKSSQEDKFLRDIVAIDLNEMEKNDDSMISLAASIEDKETLKKELEQMIQQWKAVSNSRSTQEANGEDTTGIQAAEDNLSAKIDEINAKLNDPNIPSTPDDIIAVDKNQILNILKTNQENLGAFSQNLNQDSLNSIIQSMQSIQNKTSPDFVNLNRMVEDLSTKLESYTPFSSALNSKLERMISENVSPPFIAKTQNKMQKEAWNPLTDSGALDSVKDFFTTKDRKTNNDMDRIRQISTSLQGYRNAISSIDELVSNLVVQFPEDSELKDLSAKSKQYVNAFQNLGGITTPGNVPIEGTGGGGGVGGGISGGGGGISGGGGTGGGGIGGSGGGSGGTPEQNVITNLQAIGESTFKVYNEITNDPKYAGIDATKKTEYQKAYGLIDGTVKNFSSHLNNFTLKTQEIKGLLAAPPTPAAAQESLLEEEVEDLGVL